MRIVLQCVSSASIVINGESPKEIGKGLVALVGFTQSDNQSTVDFMLSKMVNLRIFDDEEGHLNLSLPDISGELMVVSNFTLYANARKGRRPSFVEAMHPDQAIPLYDYMIDQLKADSGIKLVTGEFGANMQVSLCNNGPVTIVLDSDEIMNKK